MRTRAQCGPRCYFCWCRYEKAALLESETGEASEDEPSYLLLGRAAEMLRSGGPRLKPDYNRAGEFSLKRSERCISGTERVPV